MVPSAFEHLHALPMTSYGKLDKAALPAPSPPGTGRVDALPPRTDTEARVAALWAGLLGKPVTDVNSDFFDLGGHSLLAPRLISEVEQTFGVALSLESFIDSGRAVAKLAELLSADSPSRTSEVTSGPPLHFISCDLATAMSLRHFTERWGSAKAVHAPIPEQAGGQFDRSVTIEEHARQTLSMIRNRQPDGPLALAGDSIGGLVAYDVARQAVDAGQQIEWLGILDAMAPPLERAQSQMRWRLHSVHQRPLRERWAKYAELALSALRRLSRKSLPSSDLAATAPIRTTTSGSTAPSSASSHGRQATTSVRLGVLCIRRLPRSARTVNLKCLTALVTYSSPRRIPAASSALSRIRPAGPTNGLPIRSSWSPGCSPTSIMRAVRGPSPNTVCSASAYS